ncbi:MAG: mechanosensitive ion channel domain-containing protein [Burkholderiaceae bacterium]
MNEESFNSLLLDTWRDLQQPQMYWQWLILVGCIALAWLIARGVRGAVHKRGERYVARDPARNATLLKIRYSGLSRLFTPLFAWLLLFTAERILRAYQQPAHLIRVFAILAFAFVAIHLGLYALRRVFKPGPWLMTVERWFGLLAWLLVALHMLGLLPNVIAALSGPEATFTIGKNLTLNAWQLLSGIFWIAITLVAALWAGAALETRLMHADAIDGSMRIVLSRLGKAVLVVIAILIAMRLVDIDLTALSVFGGALGVGLGLGLQRIASNYVSGFIILIDRSLRIGDLVTVDKYYGTVTQIRTRYTVVRSLEGVEAIVPNEFFVSQAVQNHSYSDKRVNLVSKVQVAYDSDIDSAMALMLAAAKAQERVIGDPEPFVKFASFGADGIDLELSFWVADPEAGTGVLRSDINRAIWREFVAAGIDVPFPQRDVRVSLLHADERKPQVSS